MTQEEIKYHNQLWYYKTYNQLIDKCIQMESEGYPEDMYTEVHHILPKCMGGTDSRKNLIKMPVKYHITAHLLLSCIYPSDIGLLRAAILMTTTREGIRVSISTSARLKIEYSNFQKGKILSEETKKKMSKSRKGRIVSDSTKNKISLSEKGKEVSLDIRKRISDNLPEMSDDRRNYYSDITSLRVSDVSNRKKISNTLKNGSKVYGRKRVIDSEGIEYNSIKSCANSYNVSSQMLRYWIENCPEKGFRIINNENYLKPKPIQGPDGTVYSSINECSKLTKHSKRTIRSWIKNFPEKGYKYIES